MPTPTSDPAYAEALRRIRAARERRAKALDLEGLGLRELPSELWDLTWLEALNLSGNRLEALPESLGQLTNLRELNLSGNPLAALPDFLWEMRQLEVLGLGNLGLEALPKSLGQLVNLRVLDLSGNPLTSLPDFLWAMSQLEALGLGNLGLEALPESLGQLANLQWLNLSGNRLEALPESLGQLINLRELNLGWNRLEALPESLGQLTNLQELDLSRNRLEALPESLGRLANLRELNLLWNRLEALPESLGQLINLRELNLGWNRLASLSESLGQLTNLQELDLSRNRLEALPESLGRSANLQRLDLWDNRLTTLPPSLAHLTNLERLNLHGNPLTLTIPRRLLGDEIFGGDAQAILDFYRAVWAAGREWGEVRVLVVGQPGVGKTSLVRRLKEGTFDPNQASTLVVETHALPLGPYTAHFWDFGGQDIMHATHPFFFSGRAVYLLVLNVRHTEAQNRVRYWLDLIRAMGGDAPVLIVGNHADANQHRLDLPFNALRETYPNIRAYLQTSAKEGTGIAELRRALYDAIASLPHVRVRFARRHLAVKDALEERKAQGANLIPRSEYQAICRDHGLDDPQDQETLLALLHDLGVVLDFRDEDGEPLTPEGVLNPNWVTRAVYRILTDQEVRERSRGRLTEAMVKRILPRERGFATWHRNLVLKLMQRFEVAYPDPSGAAWWLPDVMPQDQPAEAAAPDWDDELVFEYEYDPRLPPGVITRFIVRTHEVIEDQSLVWRWGVILRLQRDANRALVRALPAARRVEIKVTGQPNTRRQALAYIREHFEAIHRTFVQKEGGFTITAYIRPRDYPGLRLSYGRLLVLEKCGVRETDEVWQGCAVRIPVREVLDGFVAPRDRFEELKARYPEEAKRMTEKYEKHVHIEIHGNVEDSVLNAGDESLIRQRIHKPAASPELAQALAELSRAVQAMLPHLPPERREEVQDDLARLQEELQKPKPRRKWYSLSLEGLIKAAKTVGEIGLPVLNLAERILRLLG